MTDTDVVFVSDATHSLAAALSSLEHTLFECCAIASLTGALRNIGVLFYGDYTATDRFPVVRWSGWQNSTEALLPFLSRANEISPGGDVPEACKTALKTLLTHIGSGGQTLVFWFADAPPHHPCNRDGHPNYERERKELGGDFDWVRLCKRAADGGCVFFPLVRSDDKAVLSFFHFLAWVTHGAANAVPADALEATWTAGSLRLLLQYFGCDDKLLPAFEAPLGPTREQGSFDSTPPRGLEWAKSLARAVQPKWTENDLPGYLPVARIPVKRKTLLGLSIPPAGAETVAVVSPIQLKMKQTFQSAPVGPAGAILAVRDLRRRFRGITAFRNTVMSGLEAVVGDARALQTLTRSRLFACLWREAMDRPSTRRENLLASFHKTVRTLQQAERARLKQWLEISYDASDEIENAVNSLSIHTRVPVVYLPYNSGISRPQELTEIARSCQPDALRKLLSFASRIRKAAAVDETLFRSLPIHLPAEDLVPMLPHLLFPGMIFSARSAAIFAMAIVTSQNRFLLEKAEAYLHGVRGEWLDLRLARNHSFGFLRLSRRVEELFPRAFEREESELLEISRRAQGLSMNARTDVTLRLLEKPKGVYLPDVVVDCNRCGNEISTTAVDEFRVCARCLSRPVVVAAPSTPEDIIARYLSFGPPNPKYMRAEGVIIPDYEEIGSDTDDSDDLTDDPYFQKLRQLSQEVDEKNRRPGRSWYRQCADCASRYAVSERVPSRGKPRCHVCLDVRRNNSSVERPVRSWPVSVRCRGCSAQYRVVHDRSGEAGWNCPVCTQGERVPTDSVTVSVEKLFRENKEEVFRAAGLTVEDTTDDMGDFFHTRYAAHHYRDAFLLADASTQGVGSLRWRGRQVLNAVEVVDKIWDWVQRHRAEEGMCGICCDDFRKGNLLAACGRKGCETTACADCLDRWYAEIRVGHFVPPANMNCPFCKRTPAAEVLVRHNREMCQLRRTGSLDPAWHHGFCVGCMRVKPWVERVCAGDPPTEGNFRCESCSLLNNAKEIFTQDCPGCGATVQKIVACDHITCRCGTHFCYRCGAKPPTGGIYHHLGTCRGDERYRKHFGQQGGQANGIYGYDAHEEDEDDDAYHDDYDE